jgi:hypothetical protein
MRSSQASSVGLARCRIIAPEQIEQPPNAYDGRRESEKGAEEKIRHGAILPADG